MGAGCMGDCIAVAELAATVATTGHLSNCANSDNKKKHNINDEGNCACGKTSKLLDGDFTLSLESSI